MDPFTIETFIQFDNGIDFDKEWTIFEEVEGYIDLLSGTDNNTIHNAITEESTHILIIPNYKTGITDGMRVIDKDNRMYHIDYADNPVGLNHHNELYLSYGGTI